LSSNKEKWKELWEQNPINKYTLNTEQAAWLKHVQFIGDEMFNSNLLLDSIIKSTEKNVQEAMAFMALENILPKYYDWVKDNFLKDIVKKAGV